MYSKTYFLISIFVIGFIIPKVTFCQDTWIYATSSTDNDKFYIKNEYVSKDNNIIKIWIKIEKPSITVGKQVYKNIVVKELYLFDCINKQYELLSLYAYSITGKLLHSDESNSSGYMGLKDVIPESVVEGILNKVAETFKAEVQNQHRESNINDDDKIFTKVEIEAQFPGGPAAWQKYITSCIYPEQNKLTEADYGTCIVKFIVDKTGKVSQVEATTMKGTKLAELAVNAINKGPNWTPAQQNGRQVNAYRLQPVTLTNPNQ